VLNRVLSLAFKFDLLNLIFVSDYREKPNVYNLLKIQNILPTPYSVSATSTPESQQALNPNL